SGCSLRRVANRSRSRGSFRWARTPSRSCGRTVTTPASTPTSCSGGCVPAPSARRLGDVAERSRSMPIRVGIMGFGRIGRNVFRITHPRDDIEVVAIVDVADPKSLEYLLKFDTVHGRFEEPVWIKGEFMYAEGRQIRILQAKAPGDVDWSAFDVDV